MFCFFKTVVGISAFQAVEKVTYRLLFDVDVSQSKNIAVITGRKSHYNSKTQKAFFTSCTILC